MKQQQRLELGGAGVCYNWGAIHFSSEDSISSFAASVNYARRDGAAQLLVMPEAGIGEEMFVSYINDLLDALSVGTLKIAAEVKPVRDHFVVNLRRED